MPVRLFSFRPLSIPPFIHLLPSPSHFLIVTPVFEHQVAGLSIVVLVERVFYGLSQGVCASVPAQNFECVGDIAAEWLSTLRDVSLPCRAGSPPIPWGK